MFVLFGAVGVAVDQAWVMKLAQQRGDRLVVHIHDRAIFVLFGCGAVLAQLLYISFTRRERLGEEILLEFCPVYLGAKLLVIDVVGA